MDYISFFFWGTENPSCSANERAALTANEGLIEVPAADGRMVDPDPSVHRLTSD